MLRQIFGLAITTCLLSLQLQFSSAFQHASWHYRNLDVVPAKNCPRALLSFSRRSLIPSHRSLRGEIKMALDLGSANDLILAATETASTASKSPEVQKIIDQFNSVGVQSFLKDLKSISANTPISEVQALISKASGSAEVKHLLQDIQALQNKVRTVYPKSAWSARELFRCGRSFTPRISCMPRRRSRTVAGQRFNS